MRTNWYACGGETWARVETDHGLKIQILAMFLEYFWVCKEFSRFDSRYLRVILPSIGQSHVRDCVVSIDVHLKIFQDNRIEGTAIRIRWPYLLHDSNFRCLRDSGCLTSREWRDLCQVYISLILNRDITVGHDNRIWNFNCVRDASAELDIKFIYLSLICHARTLWEIQVCIDSRWSCQGMRCVVAHAWRVYRFNHQMPDGKPAEAAQQELEK